MKESDLELIKSQSGCDDIEKIEKIYNDLNENITDTIIKLLNLNIAEVIVPPKKLNDILRDIMDSKEEAYSLQSKKITLNDNLNTINEEEIS